jgi:hypothetical protein
MKTFVPYNTQARDLEEAIARKGLALGIDWNDELQVRQLAREALDCRLGPDQPDCLPADAASRSRIELFGLAQLMLKVMAQSADDNIHTHGGPVWKAFGRALWIESGLDTPKD